MASYRTIAAPAEGLYKEKGSRFLAYAHPTADADEAQQWVQHYAKEHPKSRHVCYAWRLGAAGEETRWSDAGEPNNSAGPPILNQIKSHGLTFVLVVVVRYFGGTQLGLPGLINAYKEAANDALEKAEAIEKEETAFVEVKTDYATAESLRRQLPKISGAEVADASYAEEVVLRLRVPIGQHSALLGFINTFREVVVLP